ncbi:MAG: DUF2189 domain-containing protein [Gammaproteobacteria bacterium]|nr:MAG: DUF2189 domain-containing protein [Gammaproteobacteria bacterium]
MTTSATLGKRPFLHVEIRRVPLLRSIEWLRRGWEDLRQLGWASVAHGALIAILGAVLLMLGSTHLYLIAAAVTGYLLVGPVMTTGACELSRRRVAREPLGFDESLQGVTRNPESLMQFGAVLAAIAIVWFLVSAVMLQSVLHAPTPSLAVALWGGMTEPVNRSQILAYVGSGAVLAAIVFTLSVVAVPLIIDRHASAAEAMWASVKATLWNLPAMLIWGALILVLTALGFITLLIGMIIVAPLLGHATWHAYKDLVPQ